MTVRELRQKLYEIENQDAEVVIGCCGYLSINSEENNVNIEETKKYIYLIDSCHYDI